MSWLPAASFGLGLFAGVAALAVDGWRSARGALHVAAALLVAAAALAAAAAFEPIAPVFGMINAGGGFSALQAVCLALGAGALIAGATDLGARPHGGQVAALVAFSAVGSAALVGVRELVGLFVVLESVALLGYALVASARTRASDEAAMKYFVQGSVAAGLLVYGVGILVARAGGPQIALLTGRASLVGVVFVACALAFKLGAFPFHSWVPDAYESAPAPVAAFLSAAPKLGAMVALASLFGGRGFAASFAGLPSVFAMLAVASVIFGNVAALRQSSFARLLGYSAVANAGYALIAMVSRSPRASVALFATAYSIAALGSFAALQAVRELRPEWDGGVAGLAGLGRRSPVLAGSLAALMLSLTGIPLTVGFWGKLPLFLAAMRSTWHPALGGLRIDGVTLAVIGVVGSVVSFGYYGRVLKAAFLDPETSAEDTPGKWGGALTVALLAATLVIVLGVLPFATGLIGPLGRALALR